MVSESINSDTSLSFGISERWLIPKYSKNILVVEYNKGLPGPAPRPFILIKFFDNNVFTTPEESTPLIASISYLPIGCLYAIIASESSAAADRVSLFDFPINLRIQIS